MKQAKRTYVLTTQRSISPERMFVNWVIICFLERLLFCCYGFPVCKLGVIQFLIGTVFS